ncbi:hypothetical protein DF268_26290 [Streptomyces sp. V2]|uniref:Uncharacterized protein n=1 Tax=Streptomyces niveiscabiei TaxID=164115 RepID=A0ABW9I6T6_9ACTN|nr:MULTISPECIES: hypothetical protein [Streptomyces]PWG10585.1 hypothetical protein DF268_26290 [Streptomyces sp. V2]
MRHSIAHAFFACLRTLLSLVLPGTGQRRKAAAPTAPAPEPVIPESPWSRPWTSPSKEEAAEIFRRQAERQEQARVAYNLRRQKERRRVLEFAALGIDYPYTYPGAPFGLDEFEVGA